MSYLLVKLPGVRTDIQIRFTDLDPLGHVSNSVYAQYFDMGRMDFFSKIMEKTKCPANVVASIYIEMIREIRIRDQVYVQTWCSEKGNKSMKVVQYIYANGVCATKGTVILVGYDRKTRKSIPLPENWEPTELEEQGVS